MPVRDTLSESSNLRTDRISLTSSCDVIRKQLRYARRGDNDAVNEAK